MTAQRPQQRKANTYTKSRKPAAKPTKLDETDLSQREQFFAQRERLRQEAADHEQALAELVEADTRLSGAWDFWRGQMNEKYAMTPADTISDDGDIERA